MFHPPPRQPLPTGAISHRHTAREEYNLSAVDAITLTEIPSPPPWHCIRTIATHCPPPIEGAGGGRGSGREAGVA